MPSFVSQIISFLESALTWITALAVPATALTAGYHALMRATAQDEMAAMNHARALKNAFMYGVIVILAGAITTAVLGAFH